MKIIFVNHKKSQCGVYEFGRNIGRALDESSYRFIYVECDSILELKAVVKTEDPDLIIYNYHPATMNWLTPNATKRIKCPQIGIIHEVTQRVADLADNQLFDLHIAHDPTLLLKNPLVFKAGRLIPNYQNNFEIPDVPTIGSFGFAGKKGQKRIVEMVEHEFDNAVIRLNIPFATFGDRDGEMAKAIAAECRGAVTKVGIRLEITHDFLEEAQLLDFLARNTINLFLYEHMEEQRGISGTPDLALAVRRPIGITRQSMFRHIVDTKPSICVEDSSIKKIIENGIEPLKPYFDEWSKQIICWDYERIAKTALERPVNARNRGENRVAMQLKKVKRLIKRGLGRADETDAGQHSWISDTSIKTTMEGNLNVKGYVPAQIPNDWSLNNILDDKARGIYAGTIKQLESYLPVLMKRKIPEANVQQAFVLDTVYKLKAGHVKPKILCIGSFEDSAAEALKLVGVDIEEIDPMINYDLNAFMTKPTTRKNSFDVIFSTSVIEHVEDDVEFVDHIVSLLKIGGVAVLTCDYLDSFRYGDPKPAVDYRLYTQQDFRRRLFSEKSNCEFIDNPRWDCSEPDFWYEGINYTFAAIVVKKIK